MRFQFIEDHRDEFPIRRMCNELNVSPSGYYTWRTRPVSAREMANQELYEKIKAVYNDNHGVYGSPRIYRELKDQGVACSENRIARLMRLRELRAKQTRRFKSTTKRDKAQPAAPNLLKRDFSADRPDHKWLSDITYIPTLEGWLYLAPILDLYTRRIVGWAMSDRMTSDLDAGCSEDGTPAASARSWPHPPLRSGQPVHGPSVSGIVKGPRHPCQYERRWQLVRQCSNGELLWYLEKRVGVSLPIPYPNRGTYRSVLLHRSILQSAPTTLVAGLSQPGGL